MKFDNTFNAKRFLQLIKNDLYNNRFFFFITATAALGILLLLFLYDSINPITSSTHIAVGFYGIFLGGLIITARLFGNLHDETKVVEWHMLPASLLEKFSSRLILSTIIYACGWYLFFFLLSLVSETLCQWLFGSSQQIFNPFNPEVLHATLLCWIYQSVLLCGVVYFRKHAVAKTVLVFVLYLLLLGFFGVIALNFLFGKYSSNIGFRVYFGVKVFSMGGHMSEGLKTFFQSDGAGSIISTANWLKHIYLVYIFMPACWVVGYFRLKEMEF